MSDWNFLWCNEYQVPPSYQSAPLWEKPDSVFSVPSCYVIQDSNYLLPSWGWANPIVFLCSSPLIVLLALHWTCSSMSLYSPEDPRSGHKSSGSVWQVPNWEEESLALASWLLSCCYRQGCGWPPLLQGHSAVCCPLLLSTCCRLWLSTKTPNCISAELLFPQLSPSLSCCVGFSRLENTIRSCEPGVQLVLYTVVMTHYPVFWGGNGSKALLKSRCEQCPLLLPCPQSWLLLPQRQLIDFEHVLFGIKSTAWDNLWTNPFLIGIYCQKHGRISFSGI